MNKITLLAISFSFLFMGRIAAQNPVPNLGFELWTGSEPDDWFTTNSSPNFTVTQTTPGYTGNLALKGEVISIGPGAQLAPFIASLAGGQGFPVTQVYSDLNFWYKSFLQNGDELEASVLFSDTAGNIIAAGSVTYTASNAGWVQGTVPVLNMGGVPATCTIVFSLINPSGGQSTTGSYYIIDEVELVGSTSGVDNVITDENNFTIYPNPSRGKFILNLNQVPGSTCKVEVLDLSGKIIRVYHYHLGTSINRNIPLSLPELEKGMYLVRVNSQVRTFIIQ